MSFSKTEGRRRESESNRLEAKEQTWALQEQLRHLEKLLVEGVQQEPLRWDKLKSTERFSVPFQEPPKPVLPEQGKIPPPPPNPNDSKCLPGGMWDRLFYDPGIPATPLGFQKMHEEHLEVWRKECEFINNENEEAAKDYDVAVEKWKALIILKKKEWEEQQRKFVEDQKSYNLQLDIWKRKYLEGAPEAVVYYCQQVLNHSDYPILIPKKPRADYIPETKMLLVEYQLPSVEMMPQVKEVKYIAKEFKQIRISESQIKKLYDETLYRICLRSLFELFKADSVEALETIVFNGWVESIDRASGRAISPCIISIQANKKSFLELDLCRVDPKTCFKRLKGVGSSSLHTLDAVPPILEISRDDKRFVPARNVAVALDSSTNVAAISWEDFEHLIRELFEKEFTSCGGEVKVTRTSRDGGVDAIAFDPDPIRGGKIVIQAKRYTNVVGVAAVRDLYGTVINEGATKGILITTAEYGSDSYEFAKGKPLTLLNGGHLLHLLSKHGYRANIDLSEAKRLNNERSNPLCS